MHTSKGPVIIMNQLKPIYNSPLKNSHSHPVHTCFPIIAGNEQNDVPQAVQKNEYMQWRIQDFPEEGGPTLQGGGANIRFCQIFPKTA